MITSNAGATIDDDTGDMNMNNEFNTVIPQRFRLLQFLGFAASLSPSHMIFKSKISRRQQITADQACKVGICLGRCLFYDWRAGVAPGHDATVSKASRHVQE